MSTRLDGRISLVTGASRLIGIGAATCRALAASGADVAFTHWTTYDREQYGSRADEPDQLLAELRGIGVRAEAIEHDLAAADSAERLLNAVEQRLGPVSILVNNAAYSTRDGYEHLTAELLDRHYAVNVRAMALLSTGFARRFTGEHGGRIITFSSGQHLGPMPGELAYIASKGAIVAFTQTLAAEVADRGITVNVVNPGITDTGWIDEELERALLPKHPMGRLGRPEDVARLIAWLASDDAQWITGQIINSEGGFIRG